MTSPASQPLEAFPRWLETLGTDARELASVLRDEKLSEDGRLYLAGALCYLLRSVDLIPDGVEDLGYLDDAFVLRVAASMALAEGDGTVDLPVLARLAAERDIIADFLGEEMPRLDEYVSGLRIAVVRGRSPTDIIGDDNVAGAVTEEVESMSRSYQTPSFNRDEKTLIKLRSFLKTKLP
jgi:uncharacterized membrane protein YkvA (DUF1232 family)